MSIFIITFIISFLILFLLFNWLMGYRKGNIIIDFDDRYYSHQEHINAIKTKLTTEGKDVFYKGNSQFLIDGENYLFVERTVSIGGVPMQRTILKRQK